MNDKDDKPKIVGFKSKEQLYDEADRRAIEDALFGMAGVPEAQRQAASARNRAWHEYCVEHMVKNANYAKIAVVKKLLLKMAKGYSRIRVEYFPNTGNTMDATIYCEAERYDIDSTAIAEIEATTGDTVFVHRSSDTEIVVFEVTVRNICVPFRPMEK